MGYSSWVTESDRTEQRDTCLFFLSGWGRRDSTEAVGSQAQSDEATGMGGGENEGRGSWLLTRGPKKIPVICQEKKQQEHPGLSVNKSRPRNLLPIKGSLAGTQCETFNLNQRIGVWNKV